MNVQEAIQKIKGRTTIRDESRWFGHVPFVNYVWNIHHPDDLIKPGDGSQIAYVDNDSMNDDFKNLMKVKDDIVVKIKKRKKWRKKEMEIHTDE